MELNSEYPLSQSLLELYRKTKDNRYAEDSQAPFVVQMYDMRKDHQLGNLHISSIGKKLFMKGVKVASIDRAGTNKISLNFNTFSEANHFIETQVKEVDSYWRASIAIDRLMKIYVIKNVGTELTEEDIMSGLDEESKKVIKGFERNYKQIYSRSQSNMVTTEMVKVYAEEDIPKFISVFGVWHKIEIFVPTIAQCWNCFKYGHGINQCKSNKVCINCGNKNCTNLLAGITCNHETKCINCGKNHKSSEKKMHFLRIL